MTEAYEQVNCKKPHCNRIRISCKPSSSPASKIMSYQTILGGPKKCRPLSQPLQSQHHGTHYPDGIKYLPRTKALPALIHASEIPTMTKLVCVGACYVDTILRHVAEPLPFLSMARDINLGNSIYTHIHRFLNLQCAILPRRGLQATRVQPHRAPRWQLPQLARGAAAALGSAAWAQCDTLSHIGVALCRVPSSRQD